MKKKHIIFASIVGATALIAGSAAVTIVLSNTNSNNKINYEDNELLNESTLAEDEIFSNGLPSIVVNKEVKKTYNSSNSEELLNPVIGRQYYYNEAEGRVSIRFYAVITSVDVDAVWTRTLYNSDGSVNTALSNTKMPSSKAYSRLGYVDDKGVTQYLTPAEAVTGYVDEDDVSKYKYFVIYTLKDIKVSKYGECTIDANVELSNSTQTIVSKTGSVTTNSTPTAHTYEMDLSLENQYQGTNTSAGNGQYIYGKAKTIYASTDLSADPSNIYPIVYKDGVKQANSGTSKMTISFKDDTTSAKDNYIVYGNQAINPSLELGMFTITGDGSNVADNGQWLKFNTGGKISFTVTKATKLSMTFYQDSNNVKVYVDDVEIGQSASGDYFLPKGNVEIVAVSNGYIGKVALEMGVVSVTGLKSGVTGKQALTATYGNVSQTFDVYVLSASCAYKDADGNYVVTVDKSWTGDIGAVSGDKGNMFTTISQALEFLQNTSFVAKNGTKILNISAGYYKEKLEITTPNLTIQGAGICKGTYSDDENYEASKYNAATIIEFDSLYGEQDVNGFTQVTDSTQTVAVRESATNCKISGVTISNSWNCKAYFDNTTHTSTDHRALALLVQADKFILEDSALLGYQDTLELFTGRQYIKDSYISGTTDFIFGTNNTTLFEGCEIHSIYNGSTDGGYINAFKGCNRGSDDYINYGVIYYDCDFTADEAITSSNTSIARAWDAYQMVSIINSRIGDHISTAKYTTGTTKNQRYVAWSSSGDHMNEPTSTYVRYFEYNNEGDGAISASQSGVTYLDSTTAASYHDFATIFGTTNGKVVYNTAWDPSSDVVEKDYNVYYWFHGTAPDTGTVYQIDSQYENTSATYTVGNITFNNCYRRTEQNGDVRVDGSVEITVKAGTTVTIQTYPGYHSYKIGDVYANQDTIVYYFDTAQTITLEKAGSSFYLYSIIINERQEAQATPVMTGLSVTGYPLSELELNEEYDLSGLSVKALYSNGTYKVATGYDIDDEEVVHSDTAGTYTVTVTYNDGTTIQTQTFDITYAASVETRITETTGFTFKGGTYSGTNVKNLNDADHMNNLKTGTMEKVTFNTDGSNGVNNWLKFNNGNTITFETSDVCLLNICFYQGTNNAVVTLNGKTIELASTTGTGDQARYSYELKEAGVVVITATGSGSHYIGYFETIFGVEFPEEQEETVIENNLTISFATGENGYDSIDGVTNTCTVTDHKDGSAQISNGTITLNLKAPAIVTINGNYAIDFTIGETAVQSKNAGGSYASTTYEYLAQAGELNIVVGNTGSNYFYSITVFYPTFIEESANVTFGKDGNYASSGIDFSGCTKNSPNGDQANNQVVGNYVLYLKAGATLSIDGYNNTSYCSYTVSVNGGTPVASNNDYSITLNEDSKVVVSCDSDNYLNGITISYPISNDSITFGDDGNFDDKVSSGIISKSSNLQNSKNDGYSQVKNGTITFDVAAGTEITITGYYSVDYEITIGEDVTLVQGQDATSITKTFEVSSETTILIRCQTGENDYSKGNYLTSIVISKD